LLGLTVLGVASLAWAGLLGQDVSAAASRASLPARNTAFQLLSLGVVWFVYLFIVNERPRLTWPLALVVTIQGGVGVAQFVLQRDLGLAVLGELALDPEVRGVSVLMTEQGQRWLRAYGLTGHPNLLAALLTVLLLLLLRDLPGLHGWRRVLIATAIGAGTLGLLATVSRAAWLAFALGLGVWAFGLWRNAPAQPGGTMLSRPSQRRLLVWLAVPLAAGLGFVIFYGRQLATRFLDLNTAVEARSLIERTRDIRIALSLIYDNPLTGVGLGSYLTSARLIDRSARVVHNVPLLVTAEMGLLGGALWLWLGLAPIVVAVAEWWRGRRALLSQLAPWVALLTIGMFHGLPWINTGWRTAILLALLMGDWALVLGAVRAVEATEPASVGPQDDIRR
jgi:O-antigen ligase